MYNAPTSYYYVTEPFYTTTELKLGDILKGQYFSTDL